MKPRGWELTVWALTAALVAALAVFRITSVDFWWHLRAGEYILSRHTVPTRDVFSYTAAGRPWVSHEWLFEVLLALAHRMGALTGAILLKALIVLLGIFFTAQTLRRLKVALPIAAPLVALGAFLVTSRAYCRPHIVTEALLGLYLLVLLSYKYLPGFRLRRTRVWWLLAVQLVWANSHSGGVLGIGLFAGFIACEFVQSRLARLVGWIARDALPDAELGYLLRVAAGLLLVSLVNPSFHRALLYPLTLAGQPVYFDVIRELQPLLSRVFLATDFLRAFLVLAAIGAASFLVTPKRLELSHLMLFVAALASALSAVRNLPIFAVIAVPLAAINLQSASRRFPAERWLRLNSSRLTKTVVGLVPAALLALVFVRGVQVPGDFRRPGFGYDRRLFPVQAADFLAGHRVPGNVFSTMEFNDYFVWRLFPAHRVFIDGRLDVYGPGLLRLYSRILLSDPVADTVFPHFGIDCCVLPLPNASYGTGRRPLAQTLGQSPDWTMVYWDDLAVVFVRNTPAYAPLIAANAWHAVVPRLLSLPDTGVSDEAFLAETERASRANPESPLARTLLGLALLRGNRLDEARADFTAALARVPNYGQALFALATVNIRRQDYAAAVVPLARLVRLEPDYDLALFDLGLCYFRTGQAGRAEQALLRALKANPRMVAAYIQLGDVYQQQGRSEPAIRMWQSALGIDPQNPTARSRLNLK